MARKWRELEPFYFRVTATAPFCYFRATATCATFFSSRQWHLVVRNFYLGSVVTVWYFPW